MKLFKAGETKQKPAKKPKAKKKKTARKRSEGGIKAFLTLHTEKIVLGAVAVAALAIVFASYRKPGIDSTQSAESLSQLVDKANANMEGSSWDRIQNNPERLQDDNFIERATEDTVPIKLQYYETPQPWDPVTVSTRKKRTDPELLALEELEVKAGVGPMAYIPKSAGNLYGGVGVGGYGGDEVSGGVPGGAYPYASSGGAYGGVGYGTDGEQDDTVRAIPTEIQQQIRGYRPTGANNPTEEQFVMLAGLIPLKKQIELYKASFDDTGRPNPKRDFPRYFFFDVQRAEQQTDGKWSDWENLNVRQAVEDAAPWQTTQIEYVSPEYMYGPLTMPLPPMINRDLVKWALHSKTPRRKDRFLDPYNRQREANEEQEGEATEEKKPETQRPGFGRPGTGGRFGFQGYDTYGGGGDYSGYDAYSQGGYGGGGEEYSVGRSSGYDMENPYGSPYGVGGRAKPVDHKLLRYFDTTVESGKSYRYRVRLWLEDPNYPENPYVAPKYSRLADDVVIRIRQKKPAASPADREYWRTTPWTEPSAAVYVPSGYQVFAGTAKAPGIVTNKAQGVSFRRTDQEHSVKVVVVKHDPEENLDIPTEVDIYRGTVTNFEKKGIEGICPPEGVLKTVDCDFKSDVMVVDIRGGERLKGRKSEKAELTVPGEILVMDVSGQLSVRKELDDMDEYTRHIFPEPVDYTQGVGYGEGDGVGGYDDPYGLGYGNSKSNRRGSNSRSRNSRTRRNNQRGGGDAYDAYERGGAGGGRGRTRRQPPGGA